MKNTFKQSFSKNCVIALISTTLAFTPALAIAATAEGTAADAIQTEQVETTDWTNDDYVSSLKGLTNEERTQLKALYDKMDAHWAAVDAQTKHLEPTEEEYDRMAELEDKAWRAGILSVLTEAERTELKALWDKLDALKDDETLTDAECDRIYELENKYYDSDDEFVSRWDEEQTNEEYVKSLKGLTNAERTELVGLLNKSDAYWDAWEKLGGDGALTEADWDLMEKIENKAFFAEMAERLTDEELKELKGLYEKFEALAEGQDLTEAEWNRMSELQDKGYGNA